MVNAPDLMLSCCACEAKRPWDAFEHRCERCGEALELEVSGAAAPSAMRLQACYDGTIVTYRIQVSLDLETKRRAHKRASELGISFAQYIRGLLTRDLQTPFRDADPSIVFDLGTSHDTDIARDKDVLVGRAASAERGLGE